MKTKIALLFTPLFLLLSCRPGTKVEIVNNTEKVLTITSMDTELKETKFVVRSKEAARVEVFYKLRIHWNGNRWDYDLPQQPLPQSFRKRLRGNWHLERFQFEEGGVIYVLLPNSDTPAMNLPAQPPGFPVRPK